MEKRFILLSVAILLILTNSVIASEFSTAWPDPERSRYSEGVVEMIWDTGVWIPEEVDHLNIKWIDSLTPESPSMYHIGQKTPPAAPSAFVDLALDRTHHQPAGEQYYQAGLSLTDPYRIMAKGFADLPIPPSTLLIFASGLIGILVVRRRIVP